MAFDDLDEKGYCVFTLDDPSPVHAIREKFLGALREALGAARVTLGTCTVSTGSECRRTSVLKLNEGGAQTLSIAQVRTRRKRTIRRDGESRDGCSDHRESRHSDVVLPLRE